MNIEDEVFKRCEIVFSKLEEYGFKRVGDDYEYSIKVLDDTFLITIHISNSGEVVGRIFDLDMDEEYTNFRVEGQTGEFVSKIRETYREVLQDICNKCTNKNYFVSPQANRLASLVKERLGDSPEFPWGDESGVFRNPRNAKWYALVMNIDRRKISEDSGQVEVLNVKLDEEEIKTLLPKNGYYTCYHMNKKKWITIALDDTLPDEVIMSHIIESHGYTQKPKEWLVPANPRYYDIINCFNDSDELRWKQSSNVQKGDVVYIYVASPYSAILYKCEAVEVNIPYHYSDDNLSMDHVMDLHLIAKYDKDVFSSKVLQEYGVKSVRGPHHMPKKLSELINSK